MPNYYLTNFPNFTGWLLFPLIVWSLYWKGRALWKSAKKGQKVWFVFFLVINTVGILEIIYLLFLSDRTNKEIAKKAVLTKPSARKRR